MSTTHSTSVRNQTEERALQLLGAGVGPEQVASALGVSASRISQLLSEPEFAAGVADLRFANLQKHNRLDDKYDVMEDELMEKLKDCIGFMHKPLEILRAIQVINSAKRRGMSAPEQITHQNQVVNLVMPTVIMQQFTTNINNQVIKAGAQTLETLQSGAVKGLAARMATAAAGTTQIGNIGNTTQSHGSHGESNYGHETKLLEGVGASG